MKIEVISKTQISERFEKWILDMPKDRFAFFGHCFETLEGIGLHSFSGENGNQIEVEISRDFTADFHKLIEILQSAEF